MQYSGVCRQNGMGKQWRMQLKAHESISEGFYNNERAEEKLHKRVPMVKSDLSGGVVGICGSQITGC